MTFTRILDDLGLRIHVVPKHRQPCVECDHEHAPIVSNFLPRIWPFWVPCQGAAGEHVCRLWLHIGPHECSCKHVWGESGGHG